MEIALVIVGVLAVGLAVVTVWLAMERGRLVAAADAAARDAINAREEHERLGAQLREASSAAAAAGERAAGLERQLAEAARRGESELADAIAKCDALWEEKARRIEQVASEKLASAQRERDAVKTQLDQMEAKMREAFAAISREAMEKNSTQFLALAEQKLESKRSAVDELVKPIAETLKRTDEKLAVIESAGSSLKEETTRLVRALRDPHVRGRYGEIQLRRVAELAGMSDNCDFYEQDQTRDAEGNPLRPDMVIRMPSDRVVVVDAKTNIRAYLEAMEAATPDEAEACLERFARHVSEQATALARKKYWTQYRGSPEFVVMFIPGDQFIDAALRRQATLLERAAEQGVLLAGPSTLIGLLRAVAVGYREQRLAQAAEELRELGRELHERAATAFSHVLQLGRAINSTVESYNKFVGSYESRLEPTLKKFEDAGVKSAKELPDVQSVDTRARVTE